MFFSFDLFFFKVKDRIEPVSLWITPEKKGENHEISCNSSYFLMGNGFNMVN